MRAAPWKRAVLGGALALAGAAPGRGGPLADRAAAIDGPRVGAPIALAAPLAVGRGEIAVAPGARVHPLFAQGVPCGLLVDGPARFRYRVEDRFSVPVAERNLKRVSALAPARSEAGLEVNEELTGAVVWGWGLAPPGEAAAMPAPGAPGALPAWAAKLLAARRFTPPSHDLLAAEANGNADLRYALLFGRRENLLLHVDPAAGEENLYRLARVTDPGTTFREGVRAAPLAAQPIGRPWWVRPPAELTAEHEALRVENPAGEQIRVASRSRLRANHAGVAVWQAQLVDRAFDDPLGRQRPVTVRGVQVDGRAAEFLHDDGELVVALGRTLALGDAVEVEVALEGQLAQRPSGHSYWLLGTWPWYPRQELAGERATMEIEVDVPEALTPFASGAEVSRTTAGGRRRLVTRLEQPMQFAVVTAGKYKVIEETQDDVTCRAATYALLKEKAARELIAQFFPARRLFEELFDVPYPFRNFSIVEINSWGFGQAPPGILFLTREFYTAPVERRTRVFFQGLEERFLHEIAHGWWGHVVKMDAFEEAWLIEAFSDYTAALALWRLRGEERGGGQAFEGIVRQWVQAAAELGPGASLYLSSRLSMDDERSFDDLLRLHYAKGPLVVHALRLELQRQKGSAAEGDRHFIALLRTFLKRNHLGWGTTAGLVATLDELTGGDWQPWFERYVYGTEVPRLPR